MSYCFAIIDLGSNSVRMSVNMMKDDKSWCVVERIRETVRLSEGMSRDNFLKEDAMQRVIKAVEKFCNIAHSYKCVSIAAIATAAVRQSANKDVFLARVKEKTGLDFEVITGEEEAYYSYIAVRETAGVKNGVIFDTGGGSTEISLVKDGELKHSVSLPLGAVILQERMQHSSQMQLYRYVSSYIGAIEWLDECESLPFYGIGGSARTFAMLAKKKLLSMNEIEGLKFSYMKVSGVYQNLFNTPAEKRKDIPGMDISRADIILAGLTPMKVLMDMTGSNEVHILTAGVKEGLFYRMKNEFIKNI